MKRTPTEPYCPLEEHLADGTPSLTTFLKRYENGEVNGGVVSAKPPALGGTSQPPADLPGGLDPRDLKTALLCISFLRKGEVLAYVGRIHSLKNLKDPPSCRPTGRGHAL